LKRTFSEIIKSDRLTLVDFHATWCGPCKTMSPILDDVKSKVGAMVTILKIDVDKNQALASRFKIKSVPTLLLFKKGEIIWKKSGIVSSSELKDILLKSS